MIRLLTSNDHQLLLDFFEESKLKDPNIKPSELTAWKFYSEKLLEDAKGLNIFVEIQDERITKAYFTITGDRLFNASVKCLPFWIVSLIRSVENSTTPYAGFKDLIDLGLATMEQQGYTMLYTVVKIPKYIDYTNASSYLEKVYRKMVGNEIRYSHTFERIIEDTNSYDEFKLYQLICPRDVQSNKKIAIVRHELKLEYRK
jgi:hypothetical protein